MAVPPDAEISWYQGVIYSSDEGISQEQLKQRGAAGSPGIPPKHQLLQRDANEISYINLYMWKVKERVHEHREGQADGKGGVKDRDPASAFLQTDKPAPLVCLKVYLHFNREQLTLRRREEVAPYVFLRPC